MDLAAAAAGPGIRATRRSRDSHESVAGRPEQLANVGRSDLALRGLNDHNSTESGPTHQSDARDLCQSTWHVPGIALLSVASS